MAITPEQLKFRKGKIGASSAAQAIGRGYGRRTRAELFHTMKGNMPPVKETTAMRVGNYMEPFVLHEYTILTGRAAEEFPETQVHPDEPRIICHCDGITSDKTRLIEIKNVGHRMQEAWKDGVPEYYWVQGCVQSMLTGIKKVDFAAYFGGNELKVYEVEYTEDDHATVYDGLKDFLDYVDRDEEPPHTKADLPNLDKYYQVDRGDSVVADKHIHNTAKKLAEIKAQFKLSKEMKELSNTLEYELKEYLGESEVLRDDSGEMLFTWKQGADKEIVDWEAIVRNLLDGDERRLDSMLYQYTTVQKGRRTFLCKIKEGK
jgi:putative phage-type endonuclease